jgi:hypothetical protein
MNRGTYLFFFSVIFVHLVAFILRIHVLVLHFKRLLLDCFAFAFDVAIPTESVTVKSDASRGLYVAGCSLGVWRVVSFSAMSERFER